MIPFFVKIGEVCPFLERLAINFAQTVSGELAYLNIFETLKFPRYPTIRSVEVAERGRIRMGVSAFTSKIMRAPLFMTANTYNQDKYTYTYQTLYC